MKRFFAFGLVFFQLAAFGQSVKVVKDSIKIGAETAQGYSIDLDGTVVQVEGQLLKFLKPVGKVKKGGQESIISLPVINGKTYTSPLLFVLRDKGKGSVWMGILKSQWPASIDDVLKDIEKLVYDFGVSFYKGKIQVQIDESNQALQSVEKQQQKFLSQNKDLGTKLEGNKAQKIQLEKALENNKLEFEALNRKIAQNKKDQDSIAVASDQIKRVIEMHKERQKKVN